MSRRVFSRRDQRSDGFLKGRLSKDHIVVFWVLICMSGVVGLLADGVTKCRSRLHRVIHGDLR